MPPNRVPKKGSSFNIKIPSVPESLSSKLESALEESEQMEKELKTLRAENRRLKEAAGIAIDNPTKRPFDMSKDKIFQELFIMKRLISLWVEELPECKNFAKKWHIANDYLKRVGARSLTETLSPDKEQLAEKAFLIFATCSLVWKCFFDTTMPGATIQDSAVLEKLQQGMLRISAIKDPQSIRQWRSETFQALALSDRYHVETDAVAAKLTRFVRGLLDILAFENSVKIATILKYFDKQIAKSTERVATAIQCSPEDHIWTWSCPFSTIHKNEVEKFEIFRVEVKEGLIKGEKDMSDYDNAVGVSLFSEFLFPSLSRMQDDSGDTIVISKGWIAMIPLKEELKTVTF